MVFLVSALFTTVAAVRPAAAQAADSAAVPPVITLPVPEEGVLYLRLGEPGGVRIRRRYTNGRRRPPSAAAPAGVAQDVGAQDAGAQDVARLDRLLRRLDRGQRLELVQTPAGPVVVILEDRVGRPPDTLAVEPLAVASGGAPATMPPVVRPPVVVTPVPRAGLPPTPAEVERALFETGLFRTAQVHFAFDAHTLLSSATPTLDVVADVLARHPDLRVEVAGHTDSVGSRAYNERLSTARAAAVRDYLVARGIAPERLTAVGHGEARPLLPNDTPTGRALNRRVEFVLLGQ